MLTVDPLSSKPPHRKKNQPKSGGKAKPAQQKSPAQQPASGGTIRARKIAGEDAWELVHPRCARDRAEDLEEVRKMIDAGETEVAMDECRWLLSGCSDCLEAHRILGEIALSENDLPLARGHFGYAYRLGEKALERAGRPSPLPYRLPANQSFLESAKGLAWSLRQLDKRDMAREVVEVMLRCDPGDPLGVRSLLD
jgi:hypothetical protein